MNEKTNITLTPEQETLLITLYTKAQPENVLFFDPKNQGILNQVEYDFTRLRVPYKMVVMVCQRAKKLGAVVRAFVAEHPGGGIGYQIQLVQANGINMSAKNVNNSALSFVRRQKVICVIGGMCALVVFLVAIIAHLSEYHDLSPVITFLSDIRVTPAWPQIGLFSTPAH